MFDCFLDSDIDPALVEGSEEVGSGHGIFVSDGTFGDAAVDNFLSDDGRAESGQSLHGGESGFGVLFVEDVYLDASGFAVGGSDADAAYSAEVLVDEFIEFWTEYGVKDIFGDDFSAANVYLAFIPEAEVLENLHSFAVTRESNRFVFVVGHFALQGVRRG